MKIDKIKKGLPFIFGISFIAFISFSQFLASGFFSVLFLGLILAALSVFFWGLERGAPGVLLIILSLVFYHPDIRGVSAESVFLTSAASLAILAAAAKARDLFIGMQKTIEQHKRVVERANDGIIIVQDGLIEYANPRIKDILGYWPKEIKKTELEKHFVEEEKDKAAHLCGKREGTLVFETTLKHKSGGTVYAELSIGDISYQGREAMLVVIRDITQKKQVEEILHQRGQEFRALVERSPDIIARFDNEIRCVYINPAVEKELGINPKDFFWKTLQEAGIQKKTAAKWEQAIDAVFKNGEEKTIYVEQEVSEGIKYYQVRMLPEYGRDGKIRTVLSVARDVTEAKEIDNIKSEFISISSHQLRTPLSIIRWCSRTLLDKGTGKIDEEQENYLGKIYSANQEMIKTANALLNAAILDMGILNVNPVPVNFFEIVDGTIKEFEHLIEEKKLRVEKKYKKNIPPVKADERILKMIFNVLISNAIEYNEWEGKITVEIKNGEDILVKVADEGCGILQKDKGKIFSKFFRAENAKEKKIYGTGLDLYVIKSMVESCGGKIWFESPNPESEGGRRGTVFFFTLPKRVPAKKKEFGRMAVK